MKNKNVISKESPSSQSKWSDIGDYVASQKADFASDIEVFNGDSMRDNSQVVQRLRDPEASPSTATNAVINATPREILPPEKRNGIVRRTEESVVSQRAKISEIHERIVAEREKIREFESRSLGQKAVDLVMRTVTRDSGYLEKKYGARKSQTRIESLQQTEERGRINLREAEKSLPGIKKAQTDNVKNRLREFKIDHAKHTGEEGERYLRQAYKSIMRHERRHPVGHERERKDVDEFREMLSGPADFDEKIARGEAGISKAFTEFDGGEIPTYNLSGAEFRFLVSVQAKEGTWGGMRAEFREKKLKLLSDGNNLIKIMRMNRMQIEKEFGFSTEYISTSLMSNTLLDDNSASTAKTGVNMGLVFGYSDVQSDEVITVDSGDAKTLTGAHRSKNSESRAEDLRYLEYDNVRNPSVAWGHNEVAIDRYYDKGSGLNFYDEESREPDFIVQDSRYISDRAKKFAKELNVPIVTIDRELYKEQNLAMR